MHLQQFLKLSLFLLFSLFYFYSTASAEMKVATVNLTRVVNQTSEAQKVRAQLNKMTEDARSKLENQQTALQNMEKRLKERGVSEDSDEAESFRAEVRSFERMAKDSEEEIRNKFFLTNKKLTDAAIKVVEQYAKENNIELVLDINEKVQGPILYGAPTVDITDEIIKRFRM